MEEAKVLHFLEKAILVCFQPPETPIGTWILELNLP